MESLGSIAAFVWAVRRNSFSAAGRQLGVSASAVGKSVSRLERRLGVRLLYRTTRSLSLTEEGGLFFRHCVRVLEDLEQAEAMIAQNRAVPRGRLRVELPVTFGRLEIIPALAEFLTRYPDIKLEIRLTDGCADMVGEGIDVVVRVAEPADSRLVGRQLGRMRLVVCAAPAYLERAGVPHHPGALKRHNCLSFCHPGSGTQRPWQFLVDGREAELTPTGNLTLNNGEGLVEAASAGLGIVQVPYYMASTALQHGLLQELLSAYEPPGTPVFILWPGNRHLLPKVRVFIDFVVALSGTKLPWKKTMTGPVGGSVAA